MKRKILSCKDKKKRSVKKISSSFGEESVNETNEEFRSNDSHEILWQEQDGGTDYPVKKSSVGVTGRMRLLRNQTMGTAFGKNKYKKSVPMTPINVLLRTRNLHRVRVDVNP